MSALQQAQMPMSALQQLLHLVMAMVIFVGVTPHSQALAFAFPLATTPRGLGRSCALWQLSCSRASAPQGELLRCEPLTIAHGTERCRSSVLLGFGQRRSKLAPLSMQVLDVSTSS